MSSRSKVAVAVAAAAVLVVAVGASGAVAVSRALDGSPRDAIIEDAAEELGVEPEALADALKQALRKRVDEAVESGRLTEEQGAWLRERMEGREAPFLGRPGFPARGLGFGRAHRRHAGHSGLQAASSYLGMTEAEVRQGLRDGSTLAEIARDKGKTVDGLVDALVEAASERIDDAVGAGRLDEGRAERLRDDLEARMTDLVNGELGFRGHGRMLGPGSGLRGSPPAFAGPRG